MLGPYGQPWANIISKTSLINILEGNFRGGRLSQWPIWSPSLPDANVLIDTDFPTPQICGKRDAMEVFFSSLCEPSDQMCWYRISFKWLTLQLHSLTREHIYLLLNLSLSLSLCIECVLMTIWPNSLEVRNLLTTSVHAHILLFSHMHVQPSFVYVLMADLFSDDSILKHATGNISMACTHL